LRRAPVTSGEVGLGEPVEVSPVNVPWGAARRGTVCQAGRGDASQPTLRLGRAALGTASRSSRGCATQCWSAQRKYRCASPGGVCPLLVGRSGVRRASRGVSCCAVLGQPLPMRAEPVTASLVQLILDSPRRRLVRCGKPVKVRIGMFRQPAKWHPAAYRSRQPVRWSTSAGQAKYRQAGRVR
jgi:hypothetical protein